MSLSRRQERLLGKIAGAACRSDPRLASMLAVFARLTAGEDMPGREQLPAPSMGRLRAALTAASAAAALIFRAAAGCARAAGAVAAACTAAAGRLARPLRAAIPAWPEAATRAGVRPDPQRQPWPSPVRKEDTMRFNRHPSPLPPDPIAVTSGSPLPPGPIGVPGPSPLPPDPEAYGGELARARVRW